MNSRTALALALAGLFAAPAIPAQTCNPAIRRNAPDSRYAIDSVKGTVLDRQTGLTWKRCGEGLTGTLCGSGTMAYLTWRGALNRAAASDFAGHKDWRLPNLKELESLVEVACSYPARNAIVFPSSSGAYWASSPKAGYAGYAWVVNFNDGDIYPVERNNPNYQVWLVRGGQ